MLKDMFRKNTVYPGDGILYRAGNRQAEIPKGMWRKCKKCGATVYAGDVKKNFYSCPKCGWYFRVHALRRIEMLSDPESFTEWDREMPFVNPLSFPGYEEKALEAAEKSGLKEAIVTGEMKLNGIPCAIGVCDARFMMSSMGHNMGEKITRAAEKAAEKKLPLILFACSGGARMQEGIISLMQMAKTSAALKRLHESGQVFVSVLTDPTMGGVTASFAMLGDIILAEPNALVGFAGQRVIAQTIGAKLPEGFQRSEFLLEHGFADAVVDRRDMKEVLTRILRLHTVSPKDAAADLQVFPKEPFTPSSGTGTAWDSVELSRKKDRPTTADYIRRIFPDFLELHGDRKFADDGAVIGGIASFSGIPVTVIGQQKGRSISENRTMNYGMPYPEGYRKAKRLMEQAENFGRPVICFVDTPGAFCGIGAEERGQGQAIADNLYFMSGLKVPVLSVVIGEGGSGGALGIAVADEVWMLEHAIYSVLSPEGFAAILYKDAKRCREAAEEMKITAGELYRLGVIEQVIPEKTPVSVSDMDEVVRELEKQISGFLKKYLFMSRDELVRRRYERFRRF